MRYSASEKLEIIRLVEGSHLPVKRTLEKLGVPRPTFYRWYDRYLQRGEAGLEDRSRIRAVSGTAFLKVSGRQCWKWPWLGQN